MKLSFMSKAFWFAVSVLVVLLAVIGLSVGYWEWLNGPNGTTVRNIGLVTVGVVTLIGGRPSQRHLTYCNYYSILAHMSNCSSILTARHGNA